MLFDYGFLFIEAIIYIKLTERRKKNKTNDFLLLIASNMAIELLKSVYNGHS